MEFKYQNKQTSLGSCRRLNANLTFYHTCSDTVGIQVQQMGTVGAMHDTIMVLNDVKAFLCYS